MLYKKNKKLKVHLEETVITRNSTVLRTNLHCFSSMIKRKETLKKVFSQDLLCIVAKFNRTTIYFLSCIPTRNILLYSIKSLIEIQSSFILSKCYCPHRMKQ